MHRQPLGLVFVIVHAALGLWAIVGLVEWVALVVPWPRVTNPDLPRPLLLVHWLAMLATAATFLVGLLRAWPSTPQAMALAYGALASICAYETFVVLTNPSRFVSMVIEYTAYLLLTAALFRSQTFRSTFHQESSS